MDREEKLRRKREYYNKHKEDINERRKEYFKQYRLEHKEEAKQFRQEHKEEIREYQKQYRDSHKKEKTEYHKRYYNIPIVRARHQLATYIRMDRERGFGNVIDFDAKWIVANIYTKPCSHCGETDWHKLGCNRIDNSKGHTKDNVEPCCLSCNSQLIAKEGNNKKSISKPIMRLSIEGQPIGEYESMVEANKELAIDASSISQCCRGKIKTAGGYKWMYKKDWEALTSQS